MGRARQGLLQVLLAAIMISGCVEDPGKEDPTPAPSDMQDPAPSTGLPGNFTFQGALAALGEHVPNGTLYRATAYEIGYTSPPGGPTEPTDGRSRAWSFFFQDGMVRRTVRVHASSGDTSVDREPDRDVVNDVRHPPLVALDVVDSDAIASMARESGILGGRSNIGWIYTAHAIRMTGDASATLWPSNGTPRAAVVGDGLSFYEARAYLPQATIVAAVGQNVDGMVRWGPYADSRFVDMPPASGSDGRFGAWLLTDAHAGGIEAWVNATGVVWQGPANVTGDALGPVVDSVAAAFNETRWESLFAMQIAGGDACWRSDISGSDYTNVWYADAHTGEPRGRYCNP